MAKKILLVDDDKDFISITRSHIKNGGYDVDIAYNGKECLKKVRSGKPDLILLDVMMPGQNGFDVCKRLKSDDKTRDIPVILLTAHVRDACYMIFRHEGLETEADDYMGKPVDINKLLKSINNLLEISDNDIRKQGIDKSEIKDKILKKEKELKPCFPHESGQFAKALPEEFIILKTFSDGTKYLFRPIKPADNELLLNFCNTLTKESVAFPFFKSIKTSPQEFIQELASIDYLKDMAIGMFIRLKGKEQIVGIGHYKLNQKANSAEVSFIVRDDWQGSGIGKYLIEIIYEIAKKRGVARLEAKVYIDNKEVLSLFCDSGYKLSYYCLDVLQQMY